MANLTEKFLLLENGLRGHIKQSRKNTSPKALHDLRVTYKQIDAFLLWSLTYMQPNDASLFIAWFAKLRPLYKKAGKVRTALLMWKAGAKTGLWDSLPDVEKDLKLKLDKSSHEYAAFVAKFKFPTSKSVVGQLNKYNSIPINRLNKSKYQLVGRNLDEAMRALDSRPGEHWHTARRLLKSNCYLMKSGKRLGNKVYPKQQVVQWMELEEQLGKWHDRIVFSEFLRGVEGIDESGVAVVFGQIAAAERIVAQTVSQWRSATIDG